MVTFAAGSTATLLGVGFEMRIVRARQDYPISLSSILRAETGGVLAVNPPSYHVATFIRSYGRHGWNAQTAKIETTFFTHFSRACTATRQHRRNCARFCSKTILSLCLSEKRMAPCFFHPHTHHVFLPTCVGTHTAHTVRLILVDYGSKRDRGKHGSPESPDGYYGGCPPCDCFGVT